jgi:hypothetical protein
MSLREGILSFRYVILDSGVEVVVEMCRCLVCIDLVLLKGMGEGDSFGLESRL